MLLTEEEMNLVTMFMKGNITVPAEQLMTAAMLYESVMKKLMSPAPTPGPINE